MGGRLVGLVGRYLNRLLGTSVGWVGWRVDKLVGRFGVMFGWLNIWIAIENMKFCGPVLLCCILSIIL